MMSWRYNLIKFKDHIGLHEVYFDSDGNPNGYTENPIIAVDHDEGVDGISASLKMMIEAVEKYPCFNIEDFEQNAK